MITNHLSHRTPSLSILPLSPYITLLFETLQDIVEHAAIMVLSAISTPFKISSSTAYPNMCSYVYWFRQIYNLILLIQNLMKICIHYKNIP